MFEERAYQNELVEKLRNSIRTGHRRPLLQAPCGCHAKGTDILMADGTVRPVEDVEVGDCVMGPDSLPRRVLTLHRGSDEMYRITPIKGEPFVVNGDHILSLKIRPSARRKNHDGLDACTVRQWLSATNNYRSVRKLWRTGIDLPSRPLPIPPWLLGVLLGDGSLKQSVRVDNPDEEILSEIRRLADCVGVAVSIKKPSNRCQSYSLRTRRGQPNPLRMLLVDMGLNTLSKTKFVPSQYLLSSRHDRLHLLAGLMDTDGYLHKGGFDYLSASQQLARDVVFLSRSVGLAAYLRECQKSCPGHTGTYWRVSISGHTDMVPCRVERKKAKPRRQIKDVCVTAFAVKPLGLGEYFGFECDGDHLYLMGDFTVAHNSGKTHIAAKVISGSVKKEKRVLFLAPRRELVYQTCEKVMMEGVDHGIIMAGESRRPLAPVQVASVPTLVRRLKDNTVAPPHADLIIVDEAHLATAKSFRTLLDLYPKAVVIGLTATPCRTDGVGLGEVFDDLIVGPSIDWLINLGYLVQPRYFGGSAPDLERVGIKMGDYDQRELGKLVEDKRLLGEVVHNWLQIAPDRMTVVFTVNVSHSLALAEAFREAGIAAEHLDGSTSIDDRNAILARLRTGDTQVLTNCDVVTMGWDFPPLSCAVIARPTKSLVRFIQGAGRVLRPSPGKHDAIIIDHGGVIPGLGFIEDEHEWTLNGKAKTKREAAGKPKEPKAITCRECSFVFQGTATCPECGCDNAQRFAKAVEELQADLVEIDRKRRAAEQKNWTMEKKADFFAQLKGYGRQKKYKPGWAARKYREKFDAWPHHSIKDVAPKEPEGLVLSWIKSRNIAWAKEQEKANGVGEQNGHDVLVPKTGASGPSPTENLFSQDGQGGTGELFRPV